MLDDEQRSIFGPNGRWLWFAGGVLFVIFGVLIAALFNINKPAVQRNDAIRFAAYGMLIGICINIITAFMTGGLAFLLGDGLSASTPQGSIF